MAKRGLLLINLGSPQEPKTAAVRRYLTEFLTDKYVVDIPFVLRQVLVRAVIAPTRAGKSAAAYQKIWSEKGSPLVHHTRVFSEKVAQELKDFDIRWAMRYGEPSISARLKDWNIEELLIVPLYPQYAESSTRTAVEKAVVEAGRAGFSGTIRVLEDFYEAPEFIASEVRQIQSSLSRFSPDHILLSFHGLPEHHMTKMHTGSCEQERCTENVGHNNRFCYRAQCYATARAIKKQLSLNSDTGYSVSFQSRLGRRPWIKPYTDFVVNELARSGVKRILVVCPSFVADCLETLEEVQMRLQEQFISQGGQELRLVPSLNAEAHWIGNFARMIERTTTNLPPYLKA